MADDEPDHTREHEPFREEDDEAVGVPPKSDDTEVLPAADDTAVLEAASRPQWAGRAGVPRPPAGPGPVWPEEPEPDAGRRWWLPIVIGIAALLLVGLLGVGAWLILRAGDEPEPAASASPTARPATTSVRPATTAPTRPPTSAPATSAAPVQVAVPRLVGSPESDARATLDELGLAYRLVYREDPSAPAGIVIETKPPEGTAVPRGSEVTLVISRAPRATAPPPTTGGPTSPPPG